MADHNCGEVSPRMEQGCSLEELRLLAEPQRDDEARKGLTSNCQKGIIRAGSDEGSELPSRDLKYEIADGG